MSLTTLPPEILHTVLSHLPIPSLLSFSLTSTTNHNHHLHALHTLDIAIFPRKVNALIAFLQSDSSSDSFPFPTYPFHLQQPHQIAIILPDRPKKRTTPKSHRTRIIHLQNTLLSTLLDRYSSLHRLTFHAWDITPCTTAALSTLASLRHLSLNCDQTASRDPCLPSAYFDSPPPASSLWNALAGLGDANAGELKLRNLITLRLERAGCTSAQLRGMVAFNPGLRELRLRKVRAVDGEFVRWLGSSANPYRANIEVLRIESCAHLVLREIREFDWIAGLGGLQDLRIEGCAGVDGRLLREMCEPLGLAGEEVAVCATADSKAYDGMMEVDEACM